MGKSEIQLSKILNKTIIFLHDSKKCTNFVTSFKT